MNYIFVFICINLYLDYLEDKFDVMHNKIIKIC